jgi:hypothetical protein
MYLEKKPKTTNNLERKVSQMLSPFFVTISLLSHVEWRVVNKFGCYIVLVSTRISCPTPVRVFQFKLINVSATDFCHCQILIWLALSQTKRARETNLGPGLCQI